MNLKIVTEQKKEGAKKPIEIDPKYKGKKNAKK